VPIKRATVSVAHRSAHWLRRHRDIAGAAWLILGLAMALALLILTLGPVSWLIAGTSVMRLHGVDQADAINAVRQPMLTGLAGAAALVALGFTVRTYYLSRRGQVTDRFGKAISQLASNKLEERLGGIHALGTSWLNRRRTIRRWLASCYAVVAEDLAEAAATAIAAYIPRKTGQEAA
jgi:hypothetical protein